MAFTVIHFSDIHVRGAKDVILARAASIAAAVRSRLASRDPVLCVLSGDIAFSGKSSQYELFSQFLKTFEDTVGVYVIVAAAPGNHDLDFDLDSKAREILVKSTIQDPTTIDASVVEIAVAPQAAFFAFRDSIADAQAKPQGTPLSYAYSFTIGASPIEVRCLNSAWMSSLLEKPGTLFLPQSTVEEARHGTFVITVFHHPYNWLTPSSKATVRSIEAVSDVILTGHEHEHDRAVIHHPDTAYVSTYFEAAALQGESPDKSEFNVLQFDPEHSQYRFYHFAWNGTLYEAKDIVADWEELPLQSSRSVSQLVPTPAFSEWLEDSGIPWTSGDLGHRTRSDIFIYPDLVESFRDPTLKKVRRSIPGEKVFEAIKSQAVTYVSGPAKSGRTTLARSLFVDFAADGLAPVYLDASDPGMRASDTLPATVARQARFQYGDGSAEAFMQLPAERRVLILDNAERLRGRESDVASLINVFSRFAAFVVIFGDNSLGAMARISPDAWTKDGASQSFEIQTLNFSARERLAEKWFDRGEIDDFELSRQLEHATNVLDTITGKNYVPAYPIYVIAVLNAVEDGAVVDPKASTHGYFYDLLIRQALTTGSASRDISVYRAFLTHLAYDMYHVGRQEFLESELRESFDRYDQEIMMAGLHYEELIDELCQRGMLLRDGDVTRFRYSYLYNYFVANHLAEKIAETDARSQIDSLTKSLADEQASDILMFLAHLSHDSFIVDALLATAKSYFVGHETETLEAIKHEEQDDVPLEYLERPQLEARRDVAANKDSQMLKTSDEKSSELEGADIRKDITSAFHAIRVMGQVLKNFPGILPATSKVDLTRASCNLGLRLLKIGLTTMDKGVADRTEKAIAAIRPIYPGVPEDTLRKLAQRYLTAVRVILSYGVLKTVTMAIAAPQLERIYKLIFVGDISTAERLLQIGLSIETDKKFPAGAVVRTYDDLKNSAFARLLLKLFVIDFFDRLYVVPREKQRVCTKLGIGYKVVSIRKYERLGATSRRKALPGA